MPGKRTRNIGEKANELLYADGNYITLIFAVLIFALALALPVVAYFMAHGHIDENYLIIAFWMLEAFTAFPIFFGMIRIAGLASRKSGAELIDIFYAFESGRNYLRVIALGFIQTFKHLFSITLGCALGHLVVYLCGVPSDWSIWVISIVALVIYTLLLPLISRLYAVNFLVLTDDCGVVKAIRGSWKSTRESKRFLILFSIKNLPILIISIAAICVPLVIYTIPFLLCAYSIACRNVVLLKQNDICPEEISEGVEEINEQDS